MATTQITAEKYNPGVKDSYSCESLPGNAVVDPVSLKLKDSLEAPLRELHSSRSFILDQIRANTPEPPQAITTFENEPDDCDLLPPPATRPHFIRIMTAISECESTMTRKTGMPSGLTHEPLSTVPPPPWASPPVDRFLCALDACDIGPAEAIQQIKKQFPKLERCTITEEILNRRLMILDQRLDVEYFKDVQLAMDAQQKITGHWRELKPSSRTKMPDEMILMKMTDGHALNNGYTKSKGEEERDQRKDHIEPLVITKLAAGKSSSERCEGFVDPTKPLVTVNEEDDQNDAHQITSQQSLLERAPDPNRITMGNDTHYAIAEDAEANGNTTLPKSVKHGLAIHKDYGEAWEQLKSKKGLAWGRSVRRIDPNRQEDARRRAIRHGLAIHQDHADSWEHVKLIGKLHRRTKSRQSSQSTKSKADASARTSLDQENDMPTPLKLNGEVVGIAPAGVLKLVG